MSRIRLWSLWFVLAASLALAGCATVPDGPAEIALPYLKIFSKNAPAEDGQLPDGWRRWTLSKLKKPTDYKLVDYNGRTVVKAHARASASGLVHKLNIDPREFPLLVWQWKTTALIKTADNRTKHLEDSPLRSEERRVGKECRSRWTAYRQKKKAQQRARR